MIALHVPALDAFGTPALYARAGWLLVLGGFASGAALGLGFHREAFWGGYASFRRRLARLGHIACIALGMLDLVFGAQLANGPGSSTLQLAGALLLAGSIAMPIVCFVCAWLERSSRLFVLPVTALVSSVVLILRGLAS